VAALSTAPCLAGALATEATPCAASVHAPPLNVRILGVVTDAVAGAPARVYEPIDLGVSVRGGAAPYRNPFDPDEVAVDAVLTGPQGQRYTLPGFWDTPYRRQNDGGDIVPTGAAPGWRVRLAPTAPGMWSVVVRVHDHSGAASTTAPFRFRALPPAGDAHGFVRRAAGAGHARYFERSDGSPYFLVGENLCWPGRRGLADYDEWFGELDAAKANYVRIWMASRPLETRESGLRSYDQRNAAYFDAVLADAQRHGIACMLTFGTYGELIDGGVFGEGKWRSSPYNASNGGPVPADDPDAFFTVPAARNAYRNRLRYLVARYAAFTATGFWELWNERAAPTAWEAEMAGFLHAADPYRRPVTTSYQTTGPADVWSLPAFDLTQTHRYGDRGSLTDIATGLPGDTRAHDVYGKPHLMGEVGIDWRGSDIAFDPNRTGTNLHNGLWASALSGAAGGAATWWWDSYVQPANLYGAFTGLARFAAAVDWPNRAFEPIDLPAPEQHGGRATAAAGGARDLVLVPEAVWGAKPQEPLTIDPQAMAPAAVVSRDLVGYLYGPKKGEMQNRQSFSVHLASPSTLRILVHTVSERALLRVTVDGRVAGTFAFDPTPSGAGTYLATKAFPEYGGIYQAQFDSAREVRLPAGRHQVTVENTVGDWVLVGAYTFAGAQPVSYTPLRELALQDRGSNETLLWLQDPESNWRSDRDGKIPATWNGVLLTIPVERSGAYRVDWWDTRTGSIVSSAHVNAIRPHARLELIVAVPAFRRDIAARITAAS
jgi:hypothetical protein